MSLRNILKRTTLLNVFFHPLLLALYLLLIIIYFSPNYFNKYNATIEDIHYKGDHDNTYYYDLNGDGKSEKISTGYNTNEESIRIQHLTLEGKIYDQWMPRGYWLGLYKPIFGDFDKNGYAEIYCLSIIGDSIFLNAKELMLSDGLEIKNRFVCMAGTFSDGRTDVEDWGGKLMDINGDKLDDYVFSVHGGYSKFPRNTFAYYISNDSLLKSPLSASGLRRDIQYMDMNNDGVDELTGMSGSPENIHYPLPYTDSASWLMVMDPVKMDFLFPPKRFNLGIGSWLKPVFLHVNDNKYIATTLFSNSAKVEIDSVQLSIFNNRGEIINQKKLHGKDRYAIAFISTHQLNSNSFYLIDRMANVYKTDTTLRLIKVQNSDIENVVEVDIYFNEIIDIDEDGENEILVIGKDLKGDRVLIIYRNNFKEALVIPIAEAKTYSRMHYSLSKSNDGNLPILTLQIDNYLYHINYSKSEYYFLKYPVYFVFYLLLFLVFFGLQKVQSDIAKRKFETERQLIRQQLAISKKQLEPHFMLNTLNNIGYMFSTENKEDAQYYFGKFASLIHRGLKYADKTVTSLFEELEFVSDYLILQEKRFDEDFNFSIVSDENIDLKNIIIPHSLVYTFVENSIKHGLRPKDGEKKLEINISILKNTTIIVIADNGVGRKQSKQLKTTGTGQGLSIVANIVDGYNRLNNKSITYEVIDLMDEDGTGKGTEVRIVC